MKMKLEDLSFDNCVIVDFSRDATRNNLTLTFESYEAKSTESKPALYILECSGVKNDEFRFSPEFRTDLDRHYDLNAEDQRANEIHELRRDASGYMYLSADMISGRFYCQKYRLFRVVEVGASAVA
jgi:hypothetical protein